MSTQLPWWTYPRIDNLGGVEPFGGFPKPDSNIQIPAGYPVTALLPGTVTFVDKSSPWGSTITIALDNPLNPLATHTAYLHLRGDIQVGVGQHVTTGQLIAYNGGSQATGSQKVPLGFALYNGPQYGYGPAWAFETKANLQGQLNPVGLLNSVQGGGPMPGQLGGGGVTKTGGGSGSTGGGTGGGGTFGGPGLGAGSAGPAGPGGILPVSYNGFYYYPLIEQVHETLINTPGFYGMALALDEAEKFPGYIDLTLPATPLTIGAGSIGGVTTPALNTGLSMPDVNGIVRSIGASITDNALPFAIRANVALLGVVLLVALFIKPIGSVIQEVSPFSGGG